MEDGLSFWGCFAGGDWESSVYFIIYFDGKDLRAYVPKDGNAWNTKTKKAYGNDDENNNINDLENWNKRRKEFGYFGEINEDELFGEILPVTELIIKDIKNRLKRKP